MSQDKLFYNIWEGERTRLIKKNFQAIFSLIFILCFIHSSVSATERSYVDVENDNSLAVLAEVNDWAEEEESLEGISPFAVFSLSHSALGINKLIKSNNAFNIQKGKKIKINSVTWSPTGQKLQLGFINANNGKQYWTSNYSGGSKTGGNFSLNGPSGSYYIAIRTPSTNSQTINVKGQFEF